MLQFKDKVFDMPKKPVSAFRLYVSERMPDIIKESPKQSIQELMKQIAQEWSEGKKVNQKEYIKNAEKDKKRFVKQLKEFQKLGYYTKSKKEKEDNDEEEEKGRKSQKKTSNSKASSQKTKKNKASTSKNKSQKEKALSRSKSNKSKKVGKSQKSKK